MTFDLQNINPALGDEPQNAKKLQSLQHVPGFPLGFHEKVTVHFQKLKTVFSEKIPSSFISLKQSENRENVQVTASSEENVPEEKCAEQWLLLLRFGQTRFCLDVFWVESLQSSFRDYKEQVLKMFLVI